ncbi:hypothetical protein [Ostreiculturibacter nitratireducens]
MIAARLRERGILLRPLGDARLGSGFMRVTTSRPGGNERLIAALKDIL